jgi:hypothetical protein
LNQQLFVPVNEFPLLSGNITRNVKETVQEKTGNRREDLHRCQEFTAQRPTSLVIGALPSTDNAKLCIHRNTVTSESTLAPANMWSSFTASLRKLFGRSKKEEVTQAADEQVNKTEDVIEDGVNKTSQFYRQTEEDVKDVAKGAGELFF